MESRRSAQCGTADHTVTSDQRPNSSVFRWQRGANDKQYELRDRRGMAGCPQHSSRNHRRNRQGDHTESSKSILRATEQDHRTSEVVKTRHGNRLPPPCSILESLNTAVLIVSENLVVEIMNPAAENLLGISQARAKDQSILQLFADDDDLKDILHRVLTTGDTYVNEMRLPPTEVHAEERLVDCWVSVLTRNSGTDGLLVEMSDVTRRSKISRENTLLIQHGAGRQMVRQLAHEIKNPLGGLRGAAQLLERQLDSAELQQYTDVIICEADRLATLVETLLGPGGPPEKRPVNVHELLEYVIRVMEPEISPGIRITRDYDPGLPEIELDQDQMVQAFLNLFKNALAALEGQGKIILRSRAVMNFTIGEIRYPVVASIEFEDDGPGVTPELQHSIFYPLVTGRPDGTGLGLPVAQELISRHGGLIEFDSRPGITIFQVRVPVGAKDVVNG